ncbi:MAG: ElyC/SanA/YdcF family protein [Patescibacteria group bacterium]
MPHTKTKLIWAATKSVWPTGRIGADELQDWYAGCALAADLLHRYRDAGEPAIVLLVGALQAVGERPEVDNQLTALERLGLHQRDITVVRTGTDTIGQLEAAVDYARVWDSDLVVVSTFLHYPRVRWLCRGKGYRHFVAWGRPRPYEAVTDLIATPLYPIVDKLGLVERGRKKVLERRASGKL